MAKPNYHHARKQKELARKARQQEKQQKRATRPDGLGESPGPGGPESPVPQADPVAGGTSGSGT